MSTTQPDWRKAHADWIKRNRAWEAYLQGTSDRECGIIMGVRNFDSVAKIEGWDECRKKWIAEFEEKGNYAGCVMPWQDKSKAELDLMAADVADDARTRQQNLDAFTLYCRGMSGRDICEKVGVSAKLLHFWSGSQKWTTCKRRLDAGDEQPAVPWDMEGVPQTLELAVEIMEAQCRAIHWLNAKTIAKAAEFANELTGEEIFHNIGRVKDLTACVNDVFPHAPGGGNAIQINIGQAVKNIKIPEPKTFDVQLEVAE